jgi:hypothetical protein
MAQAYSAGCCNKDILKLWNLISVVASSTLSQFKYRDLVDFASP